VVRRLASVPQESRKLAAVPLGGATSAALTDIAIQKAGNQPYSLGQTLE
jgi:hypothetical protein